MRFTPKVSREAAASRDTETLIEDYRTLALFTHDGGRHELKEVIVATLEVIKDELRSRDVRIPKIMV
jgi:hypothetical protein